MQQHPENQRLHMEVPLGITVFSLALNGANKFIPKCVILFLAAENKTLNTKGSVHRAYQKLH